MSKRKFTGNISGKGYYIALILCACAIGISGYLYYRNTNKPSADVQEPTASVADTTNRQDVPAAATRPVQDMLPTTQSPAATEAPAVEKPGKRVSPLSGQTVSGYAVDCLSYNQTTRDWRVHDGVDIAAQTGAEVVAAADGEVYSVYEDETMGMTVVLVHSGGYTTRYSSLAQEVCVQPGDPVQAGQTIGYVGRTALLESAIGEHVHFSVSCSGQSVDPMAFLEEE